MVLDWCAPSVVCYSLAFKGHPRLGKWVRAEEWVGQDPHKLDRCYCLAKLTPVPVCCTAPTTPRVSGPVKTPLLVCFRSKVILMERPRSCCADTHTTWKTLSLQEWPPSLASYSITKAPVSHAHNRCLQQQTFTSLDKVLQMPSMSDFVAPYIHTAL